MPAGRSTRRPGNCRSDPQPACSPGRISNPESSVAQTAQRSCQTTCIEERKAWRASERSRRAPTQGLYGGSRRHQPSLVGVVEKAARPYAPNHRGHLVERPLIIGSRLFAGDFRHDNAMSLHSDKEATLVDIRRSEEIRTKFAVRSTHAYNRLVIIAKHGLAMQRRSSPRETPRVDGRLGESAMPPLGPRSDSWQL